MIELYLVLIFSIQLRKNTKKKNNVFNPRNDTNLKNKEWT